MCPSSMYSVYKYVFLPDSGGHHWGSSICGVVCSLGAAVRPVQNLSLLSFLSTYGSAVDYNYLSVLRVR